MGIRNESVSKILSKYGLDYDNYHLVVSRLEPENNVSMIIQGYKASNAKKKLAIVGTVLNNKYCQSLLRNKDDNILFLGGIYDKETISVIRANAYSYWHGHSVGGTNPSLLEAMGSANLCVCHDNVFNRSTLKNNGLFFKNIEEVKFLFDRIEAFRDREMRIKVLALAKQHYSWQRIANEYRRLFLVVSRRRR
jgi:rhamnosyltransferase